MSSRRVRLLLALFLILSTLPLLGAGNGNRNDEAARAEHQRIVDFWTPERVAQAVPRNFVFDPGTRGFSPSKKPDGPPGGGRGGGGGGGGEQSTLVAGASWNDNGEIDGAVGKVLFEMGGSYWLCSATVITDGVAAGNDSALILTAAHCAYDNDLNAKEFATNWMFIPDYDDTPVSLTTNGSFCESTAYGCWTASDELSDLGESAMVVHSGFAVPNGFTAAILPYDFAVVRVGLGGFSTSEVELDDALGGGVSAQLVSFSTVTGADTYAFGYPAQKKWKGNDLIYCRGPVDTDPIQNGATYRLSECKLNGGSSGGGWLFPFSDGSGTVVSVNSYGYNGINAMHGPILGDDTLAVYNAAKTTGSNTVVLP